jgi:hypothetical protein
MKELASIIQSLSDFEVEIYKKLYGSGNPEQPNKPEMLFDFLRSNGNATEREVLKALYANAKSAVSAFAHLKNKLRKQINAVLIVADAEETDTDKDADFNSVHRELTRKYLEGFILIKKKLNQTYIALMEEIYQQAKEYEMFHFWIHTIMSRIALNAAKGEKYINSLSAELEHAIACYVKYYKGDMMLWKLTPAMYLKNREADYIDYARDVVRQLNDYANENPSIFLSMNLLEGQYFLAEFERRHADMLFYSREKYELVTTSKPLSKKGVIRNARIQLIGALISNGKYEEADVLAYNHLSDIPPQSLINYLESAFRTALYCKNFKHCAEYLKLLEKNPKFIKDEVVTTQYYFYKAALAFYQKDFEGVFKNVAKTGWMLRDKTGWGLGVKLMEILAYIELGQTDMVMFRIKALWQLLYRNHSKNIARIKAVSHILYALLQSGFNYRKVVEKEKQKITELRDASGVYYWDPTGYEITRFDWWLDDKMKRIR